MSLTDGIASSRIRLIKVVASATLVAKCITPFQIYDSFALPSFLRIVVLR